MTSYDGNACKDEIQFTSRNQIDRDNEVLLRTIASQSNVNHQKGPFKKRIGPYSYYLKDAIGSGFTGVVYRGIKDNNKQQKYALKVIGLSKMSLSQKELLDNEIKILRSINHPHILKLYDIYYTVNNCYIITEYCAGGNLEKIIQNNQKIDWWNIVWQIGKAAQFLAQNNIIHRDIKPANIFYSNNVWKLGDFGFAKFISGKNTILVQKQIIGSPMFMPLESLERYYYSSRTDSFAIGILIYFLVFRQFPWMSYTQQELISKYKNIAFDKQFLKFLSPKIAELIEKLVNQNYIQRPHLTQCDFQIFKHYRPLKDIKQKIQILQSKYSQQLTLCQFINYYIKNSKHYFSKDNLLIELLKKFLSYLIFVFKWNQQSSMINLAYNFEIVIKQQIFDNWDYYNLLNHLKRNVLILIKEQKRLFRVLLQKLLGFYHVLQSLMYKEMNEVLKSFQELRVHTDFSWLESNQERIAAWCDAIDFYQL